MDSQLAARARRQAHVPELPQPSSRSTEGVLVDMLYPVRGRLHARDRGSHLNEFREFEDGEVISGTRYRVLSLIGVGGMGSVYEVEHVELGKRFVLKALLRELSRRDDLVQRLRNEWRALARLQHASIVNVTDAGTSSNGVPFYVMERLDGDTLAGVLREKRRLHVLDAVHVAASVLEALSAAHDIGIIHRDVKPANVFLVNGGGVKLLDFGIAKIADATSVVTARGLAVGTPRYMSPEQARGERVDGRSDIYASALILYEMLAGVGPFDDVHEANDLLLAHLAREAPRLSTFLSGVSPELEQILANMLAKDCRQRPVNARAAAELLRDFSDRQRALPATDAPTAKAGYGADTVDGSARERLVRPINEALTRAEGHARSRPPRGGRLSDDSLTQPIAHAPDTTQVTLSASTGESLALSSVPNTTFVSPPSFDGTTTLQMATLPRPPGMRDDRSSPPPASERLSDRPERTEMLGDFPVPPPFEPADTRTQVPLFERRQPSITPPPVVDTGREERSKTRGARLGRIIGLAAGGALALGCLAFVVIRMGRGADDDSIAAPPAVQAQRPLERHPAPEIPASHPAEPTSSREGVASAGSVAPPATAETAPPASSAALAPIPAPAPAASAQVDSRTIFSVKALNALPANRRTRGAAPASGPNARNIGTRPKSPELPESGL